MGVLPLHYLWGFCGAGCCSFYEGGECFGYLFRGCLVGVIFVEGMAVCFVKFRVGGCVGSLFVMC